MGSQHNNHTEHTNGTVAHHVNGNGALSHTANGVSSASVSAHGTERTTASNPVREFAMVLLAGALKPSTLRQQIDVPALALPIAADRLLLDLWMNLIERDSRCRWLKILVSSRSDQRVVSNALAKRRTSKQLEVEVISDPTPWRGPAGLLRDVVHAADLRTDSAVLVAEAACLPPTSLDALLDGLSTAVDGVVGSTRLNEPAGLYVFRAGILSSQSPRGYHDIKEQLLPDLFARGVAVVPSQVVDELLPIRSLESYLHAVEVIQLSEPGFQRRSESAIVSPTAHVAENCLLDEDVVIEDGAIVHRSILLRGAKVAGGAVISNSVIGVGVHVEPRRLIRNMILGQQHKQQDQDMVSLKSVARRLDLLSMRPPQQPRSYS